MMTMKPCQTQIVRLVYLETHQMRGNYYGKSPIVRQISCKAQVQRPPDLVQQGQQISRMDLV